jgi:hypothetical protein
MGSDREATKQNLVGMRRSVKSGFADVSSKASLFALQRAFGGGRGVCIPSRLTRTRARLCNAADGIVPIRGANPWA